MFSIIKAIKVRKVPDIIIIDKDKTKKLDDYTPVAGAVRSRTIPDWIVMIVTDEKYRNVISEKAEKILFS